MAPNVDPNALNKYAIEIWPDGTAYSNGKLLPEGTVTITKATDTIITFVFNHDISGLSHLTPTLKKVVHNDYQSKTNRDKLSARGKSSYGPQRSH